ncbi:hypothetical protein GOODEAATRI_018861 [Goodea atripinnis]|uniref:Secreted protein n=1 Tax=Goodea atripinnis TaxID=208336 RepID=A0ABV0MIY9_9TELE
MVLRSVNASGCSGEIRAWIWCCTCLQLIPVFPSHHWIPSSHFNAINDTSLRSSLLGSFSKGFRPAEGHGCRGSAGAGRKAVPLCQRGRAA